MTGPDPTSTGLDRQQEAVRSALRIFERDGESATTMRAVAREAGLSPAGLRHYFPTRDALLTAVLKSIDQPFETSLTRHGVRLEPDELLAAALARNRRHPVRAALYLTLLAAVNPKHPAVRYLRARHDRWRVMIADYVREKQELGEMAADLDAEHVARSLLAAAEGIQNQWLADRTIDMADHVRRAWRDAIS